MLKTSFEHAPFQQAIGTHDSDSLACTICNSGPPDTTINYVHESRARLSSRWPIPSGLYRHRHTLQSTREVLGRDSRPVGCGLEPPWRGPDFIRRSALAD